METEDFEISDLARDNADRIIDIVTQGSEDEYSRMQICYSFELPDTSKERRILNEVAKIYNEIVEPKKGETSNLLVAQGTQSVFSLCKILLDGKFKYLKDGYGALGSHDDNLLNTGYYDNGWGVFAVKSSIVESDEEEYKVIPLEDLEAILLPTPIVDIVGNEFLEQAQLLKGYLQFANELKQRSRYRLAFERGLDENFKQVFIDVSLYAGEEKKRDKRFDYKYFPVKAGIEEEIAQFIRNIVIEFIKKKFGERNSDGNKTYCLTYGKYLHNSLVARLEKIIAEE